MTDAKPGFVEQIRSFPRTFYVANTMEIFERMAWYGFFALSSLYIEGPKETGGLGFTSEARGQLQAIVPFILYLLPVVTGALADRYGYKKMFIIAYTGMVASYYALGQFKTFPTFLIAFLAVALFAAIFKPVVVGTVARVTNAGNSALGFGIFYMMVNIGGFFGPMVAGIIRGMSWRYVFIACSMWAAVNLLIVLIFYRDPSTESSSGKKRTLGQVARDMVEVLGNVRFGLCVFVVLISLMVANQGPSWFSWIHCLIFVPVWLVANFIWDAAMPVGSGNPNHPSAQGRPFFLKRMHCSNWRFAVYLLIMSGFWTSFNQIFLTTSLYVRDFTETKPMVDMGRKVCNSLGKPDWIDGLAAVEETEIMDEFDTLVRRAGAVGPMVAPEPPKDEAARKSQTDAAKKAVEDREKRKGALDTDPSLNATILATLKSTADRINVPRSIKPTTVEATSRPNKDEPPAPLEVIDLVDAARDCLGFKVRIQPTEIGDLIERAQKAPVVIDDAGLASATAAMNKRLSSRGKAAFEGADVAGLHQAIRSLLTTHGRTPPMGAVSDSAKVLSTPAREIEPKELAIAVRDLAYRPVIWQRLDAGRQVNPEHIVNFDALAIVLLQVLISFMMGKFHQFTTMIVGMVIAAIGIGAACIAGGTQIGPIGASLLVVVAGIVIFAIGEMMASPTSQEYVGRIAPKDRVAVYMGYYFIAVAMGNLFGGILSGQLYGKLARDMQRPDLMWLAFGGIMLATAITFLLYNRFALPRDGSGMKATA